MQRSSIGSSFGKGAKGAALKSRGVWAHVLRRMEESGLFSCTEEEL